MAGAVPHFENTEGPASATLHYFRVKSRYSIVGRRCIISCALAKEITLPSTLPAIYLSTQ